GYAVAGAPSIPMVEKPTAMAAEGDRGPDAPRLPVPPGATEAVSDPARLLAVPKRAPFEPGKARYTSGAWRIDWATLLKRVYETALATSSNSSASTSRLPGSLAHAPPPTTSTRLRRTTGDAASQQPGRAAARRSPERPA